MYRYAFSEENSMKYKTKEKLKKAIQFIANPRLLVCLGFAWIITNGWSYIMFGIGTYYGIGWMIAVSSAYLAFLWLPISPEKIATVAIAIVLLRLFFPKDKKTLAVLHQMSKKVKDAVKSKKKAKETDKTDISDQNDTFKH